MPMVLVAAVIDANMIYYVPCANEIQWMDDCGTLVLLSRVANLPYKGGAQTVCNTLTAEKDERQRLDLQ